MIPFLLSSAFVLAVLAWRKIPLVSPYGVFIAFQCLYNVIPWMIRGLDSTIFPIDSDVISVQLALASSANIAFALAIALVYRRVDFAAANETKRDESRLIFCCVPVFIAAAILCYFYGWHTFAALGSADSGTFLNSLAAYTKTACVAAYFFAVSRYGIGRTSWIMFLGVMLIMIIDGARTNFFPVIILALMFSQERYNVKTWKLGVFFLGAIVSMQLIRGLLVGSNDLVLGPMFTEAYMSSYSTRQSIFAILHVANVPYQYGIGSIENWAKEIYQYTPGEFAPMGGFYFIAEAVAHFGYFGPAIFAFIFGSVLAYSEQWRRNRKFLYMAFNGTIGVLYVKTPLMGEVKLFIALLVCLGAFECYHRSKSILAYFVPNDSKSISQKA